MSSGGLAIGVLVRRAKDSAAGIPDLSDSVLSDPTSLIFGVVFVAEWLLIMLTVTAIEELKPLHNAREFYAGRSNIGSIRKVVLIANRTLVLFATYLWPYFIIAIIGLNALTGDPQQAIKLFGWWCLTLVSGWFGWRDREAGKAPLESETLQRNAIHLLGLPEIEGRFAVITLAAALVFGYLQYDKVAQPFGGGKPEDAVVFLKQPATTSQDEFSRIDGQLVQIVFRRGSKIGIRISNMTANQFLVLDASQFDHVYTGKQIKEFKLPTR